MSDGYVLRMDVLGSDPANKYATAATMEDMRRWLDIEVGAGNWTWCFVLFVLEVWLPTADIATHFKLRYSEYLCDED